MVDSSDYSYRLKQWLKSIVNSPFFTEDDKNSSLYRWFEFIAQVSLWAVSQVLIAYAGVLCFTLKLGKFVEFIWTVIVVLALCYMTTYFINHMVFPNKKHGKVP